MDIGTDIIAERYFEFSKHERCIKIRTPRNFHLQLISYPETVLSSKSMPPRKAKHEINSSFKTPLEKSAFAQPESENSATATDANTDPTKPSQVLQSKEGFELEKEQVLCDLEENINASILSGDISNLSTVSTFSKDLIDACANASAEMLDLHFNTL